MDDFDHLVIVLGVELFLNGANEVLFFGWVGEVGHKPLLFEGLVLFNFFGEWRLNMDFLFFLGMGPNIFLDDFFQVFSLFEVLEIKFADSIHGIKVQQIVGIGLKVFVALEKLENQIFNFIVLPFIRFVSGHVPDFVGDLLIDFGLGLLDVLHEGINSLDFVHVDHELIPFLHVVVDFVRQIRLRQQVGVHLHKAII